MTGNVLSLCDCFQELSSSVLDDSKVFPQLESEMLVLEDLYTAKQLGYVDTELSTYLLNVNLVIL